ncbi:serine hydrolase [Maribacter stanieri]|uniref:serine hydrolase n=1 Tax=Maribacter stanieri TaxID=440514 RepID=UPI0024943975|nr:serine hydrolase [Maribacter stanieri]|tara:strand:+ start:516 stop:1985 length:1470 start_codon:yes stop_codon:yes gene_type:complete
MKFIYTFALVVAAQLCFSQQLPEELKGIDDDINHLIEQYNAVGLSVSIVKDNKIIYSQGFGYRDLENKLPVTANTVFPIASITKSFTGSLLGILESQNQVSLKEKPAFYIPEFKFFNEKMDNLITIEDLLSHKSGIGSQGTTLEFFPDNDKLKTVQRLKYLKPEGEIKNSFQYSNMGYILAGTIVEQITNKSWEKNIEEKIFKPLDMNNSYTTRSEMKKSNNYSFGYGLYKGNIEKVEFQKPYSLSPAGAINSTVNDMSKWIITWLNKGDFNKTQVIPKEYIHKATILQNSNGGNYEKEAFLLGDGFGWRLRSSYGHYRVEHGGNTFGFSTDLMMFPFENIGIVILTNQDNSLLPYMVGDNIVRRLFNLKSKPEYPVNVTEIFKPIPYKPLNKDKMPTHTLNSFCGTYEAKGFGKVEIVKEGDKLYAVLPTFKFQLEHLNYDSFFFKATKEFKYSFNPQFDIQFFSNTKGNITSLKLYSQKEPIEFNKE